MHNPPHPGEALRLDVLPALGINADALATHLGFSPRHLRAVLNGRLPVRAELAHRLELAGLGSARQYLAEQQ
ncbi:HigA family addiction module antitoxin [Pseudomonas aeruginosa]